MLNCYTSEPRTHACSIVAIPCDEFQGFLLAQTARVQLQLKALGFKAEPGTFCVLTSEAGEREQVLLGVDKKDDLRAVGMLPLLLPEGLYALDQDSMRPALQQAAVYWGLGTYQFERYKTARRKPAVLVLPKQCDDALVENMVSATHLGRNLINTPTEDMGPLDLAEAVAELAAAYGADVSQIIDEALLDENYPAIFTVGRAGSQMPRLIDLTWGDPSHPKITLVGKGVCFDTGGLDIKTGGSMLLMKKDMGGAAHVIALAKMIMQDNLPLRLRVLIPAVENGISSESYRPGDIIKMRNGKTVEITNTDAEGRLVLADALTEASSERPELLIDFATLTGAARVALGPQIGNLFSNNDELARQLVSVAAQERDCLWQMPLYTAYQTYLTSLIADMSNSGLNGFAGAIQAALFLSNFISQDVDWVHCDVSGWSFEARPGHAVGGDLIGARAMFMYLRQRYSSRH
ncbi:MAG: leucyl aminopeptidase [Gammaproteobacteria bacterium CG11_big_fil_rev_8_21_14_0_20_46_22]|nr:MAG: leucyl aminopeptidase [Gammaproteobacteria bacterium CG12_big_fil_rev_8_21_14_0_65_46_12]PIR11219.1 MAG: leucyl aminopeptidase [Gammaproteobacteria bacterium CG11_big_fil_rev_8_21_14_0_20_46_22]